MQQCDNCKKEIKIRTYRAKIYKNHFCSNQCRFVWWKRINNKKRKNTTCQYCKKLIQNNLISRPLKTCSKQCFKNLQSISKLAKNNPMWKESVGRIALHGWIKKRLFKTKFCEECKKAPPRDLANISIKFNKKTYTRDLKNWRWLCRKCHMLSDGRMKNLKQNKPAEHTCI